MKDPIAVMCHNIVKYDREHPTPEIAPRLIDANAITKTLRGRYNLKVDTDRPIATGIDLAIGIVDDAPTIDAMPVAHAHWIGGYSFQNGGFTYSKPVCSKCNKANDSKTKYCPHCAALMDGKDDSHE